MADFDNMDNGTPGGGEEQPKPRKRHRILKAALILLAVLVVIAGGVAFALNHVMSGADRSRIGGL